MTTLWHVKNHDAFCVSTHTHIVISPQSNYVTFQTTFLSSFRRKNDKASPKDFQPFHFVRAAFGFQMNFASFRAQHVVVAGADFNSFSSIPGTV